MAGVYCARCQTQVKLEQDGLSCSNCGRQIVRADAYDTPPDHPPTPTPPPRKPPRRTRKHARRPKTRPTPTPTPPASPTQAA